jgi:flagellar FliJ protein
VKRFRFSLEKVLRLRAQETEQAKRALAQAMGAEAAAAEALSEARETLQHRTAEATAQERAGLVAAEFGALRNYLIFLQRQVEAAEAALGAAKALTQQRRLELLRARRRERALEKLRERRFAQYQLEAMREEQKELDEYGSRQTLNNQASEPEI